MSKLTEIATGWFNFINAPGGYQELALRRLAVCDTCPYKQELGQTAATIITAVRPGSSTYRCGKCGCPLSAKVLAPQSDCPDNRW